MYVKDQMAKNPCCITKDTPISTALDIMSSHNFHRLPVVDENNRLIGLVTEGIITENTPSQATSLSIYELNYLLSKSKVGDIMIEEVQKIGPNALLEEAATIMKEHTIGCLPVVDEDNKVIGIITQNDIFSAFIDLLGYRKDGTRYVINLQEDKVGTLQKIAACLSAMNINIINLAVYHNERGIEVVVIATGDHSDECKAGLEAAGYCVSDVIKNH